MWRNLPLCPILPPITGNYAKTNQLGKMDQTVLSLRNVDYRKGLLLFYFGQLNYGKIQLFFSFFFFPFFGSFTAGNKYYLDKTRQNWNLTECHAKIKNYKSSLQSIEKQCNILITVLGGDLTKKVFAI